MIADLASVARLEVPDDAVVVVGSGAAGLVLAERLAEDGRDVVLLESGDDVAAGATGTAELDDLNAGASTGVTYVGLEQGRTRVIGGAAQLWHGQCMRLHPIDVEPRPWLQHTGWPLQLDDIARWYPEAEGWLDVSGVGYGGARWAEHPNLTPLDWDARRLLHDFTEYTPQPLLGSGHRAVLAAHPRVRVYVNATVSRVLTEAGRVSGLEIALPGGRRITTAARTVALCGGAVENARLLQLSDAEGIGLGTGRTHVGRYLQDHPVIVTADVEPADYRVLQDRYVALHHSGRRLFPKVRLAPDAQREFGLVDAVAVFMHEHDRPAVAAARRLLAAARARQVPDGAVRDLGSLGRAAVPLAVDAYRRYVRGLPTGTRPTSVKLQLWLEQEPDPDSRLTLGADVDALGMRRAEVHWRVGDREIETSRVMTRWIAEDLRRMGVATLRETAAMHDDDAWRGTVRDAYHPAGTTRMSVSPADGVVDPDLQVHGVPGLHVVGGSVFPVCGYANPTLTIVALALRLADHLRVPATSV